MLIQSNINKRSESSRIQSDSRWVKRPVENDNAKLRLICFSYAGGSSSIFRNWPKYLSTEIELCAIQLPGRENRFNEPAMTSLDEIVIQLVDILQPYMDRPFAFYGHSMGTLIAFELARELRRLNKTLPQQLLVSGRCAPQTPDPGQQLHQLPYEEFVEGLRRYNGTPEAVLNDKELMELLVPLLRADFTVCETFNYKPQPPLECPISAFAGVDEISSKLLDGWKEQTAGDFDSELFQGGHFFINTEQERFVTALSKRLEQKLP